VPKGTPKDIVDKLNAAAVDALNDPAVRKQLENLGLQMPPKDQLTPQALGAWQKGRNCKMVADDQGSQRQGGLRLGHPNWTSAEDLPVLCTHFQYPGSEFGQACRGGTAIVFYRLPVTTHSR
jgi:hypothetical protein